MDDVFAHNIKEREDVCALLHLNEASILHNVICRYDATRIYTWISRILIAVNPFEQLPELYTPEVRKEYAERDPRNAPPHLYATGEAAYRGMMHGKRNQSIVVSGESGAGKTVANRCATSLPLPPRLFPRGWQPRGHAGT